MLIPYRALLDELVAHSRRIFGPTLVGVYLHGSAAMGCFHPCCSDLDLLTVVDTQPGTPQKRAYLDAIVALNARAPQKGLELSLLHRDACKPFVHPAPYLLHFSPAHLPLYHADPAAYLQALQGVDADLAAHVTVLCQRGLVLYGASIPAVFAQPAPADYYHSIYCDISDAPARAAQAPLYTTLNLCRVLGYVATGAVLSKAEGGQWALAHLPAAHRPLLCAALQAYRKGTHLSCSPAAVVAFAQYCLGQLPRPQGKIPL